MTPKEKAIELFERFRTEIVSFLGDSIKDKNAKKCALIAVDEIMECTKNGLGITKYSKEYWQKVKTEIQNL